MKLVRLALLVAFLAFAGLPLATQAQEPIPELSPEQRRLVEGLPPVDKVRAALPPRSDPAEAAVQEWRVLSWFSDMAYEIVPGRRSKEVHQIINQYQWEAHGSYSKALELLGLTRDSPGMLVEKRMAEVWQRLYPTQSETNDMLYRVIEATTSGAMLDHASGLLGHQIKSFSRSLPKNALGKAVAQLPEPLRSYVEKLLSLPLWMWMTFFAAWIVLGISFRATPVTLRADDPWVLQKGRKQLRMSHELVTVQNKKDTVTIHRTERYEVDEYRRRQPGGRVLETRIHEAVYSVRREDGQESWFSLLNSATDIRDGHRLLLVRDARKGTLLFVYNRDTHSYTMTQLHKKFVKVWPLVLLPVAGLAWAITLTQAPIFASVAFFGAGLVYLLVMRLVNGHRARRFVGKMAPQLVALAASRG